MKEQETSLTEEDRKEIPSYISMEEFIKKYDASARSTPMLRNEKENAPLNAIDMLFIASLTIILITLLLLLA